MVKSYNGLMPMEQRHNVIPMKRLVSDEVCVIKQSELDALVARIEQLESQSVQRVEPSDARTIPPKSQVKAAEQSGMLHVSVDTLTMLLEKFEPRTLNPIYRENKDETSSTQADQKRQFEMDVKIDVERERMLLYRIAVGVLALTTTGLLRACADLLVSL